MSKTPSRVAQLKQALHSFTALTPPALAVSIMLSTHGHANPVGAQIVGGEATISSPDAQTTRIDQHTDRAIIDWERFDIAPDESTQFVQPSSNSIALNRVVGSTEPSQIAGRLTANGQIVIVNQNGIVFGEDARIDVGALIATTHDIENDDFLAGRMNFNIAGRPGAAVTNLGSITAADRGLVALVAPSVRNDGTIIARLGKVALAAGNGFTVDMYGDDLIQLVVDEDHPAAQHLVQNTGRISADGGYVLLTAISARDVVDSVVNTDGIIEARSIGSVNGEIVLLGGDEGTVSAAGTLNVSGGNDGEAGGRIIATGEDVTIASGAQLNADGDTGGGRILIGGDYLGGNSPDSAPHSAAALEDSVIRNADQTIIEDDAMLSASALTEGDGGKVVVWSDVTTQVDGDIQAQGIGDRSGGFIETSSSMNLGVGVGEISAGIGGLWLLDPETVRILPSNPQRDTSTSSTSDGETVFDGPNNTTISSLTINAALNTGTDVTITATDRIDAIPFSTIRTGPLISENVDGPSTLRFEAGNEIAFSGRFSGNELNVEMEAPSIDFRPTIVNLGGGDLTLRSNNDIAFQPGRLIGVENLSISSDRSLRVGISGGSSNLISPDRIESVLNEGGTVDLEVRGDSRSILFEEPIEKSEGGEATLNVAARSIIVDSNIRSTSNELNLRFRGVGPVNSLQIETSVQNGVQDVRVIDTNGGDFDFEGAAFSLPSTNISFVGGVVDIPLEAPTIVTQGGDVRLHILGGPLLGAPNNGTLGCQTQAFCRPDAPFSVDAGTGNITLSSDTLSSDIGDLPRIVLSDRALRTDGELRIDGVRVEERAPTFTDASRTVQFDGRGNDVDAAQYDTLALIRGSFDVEDVTVTGTPPPTPRPVVAITSSVTLPTANGGEAFSFTTEVLFDDESSLSELTIVSGEDAFADLGIAIALNPEGTVTLSGDVPLSPGQSFTRTRSFVVSDADGNEATVEFVLTLVNPVPPPTDNPPVAVEGAINLPSVTRGEEYSETTGVLFTDDAPLTDLAVRIDGLPAGLSGTLNSDGTLTISGTPIRSGTFTIDVTVQDASGGMANNSISITVVDPTPPPPTDNPPVPLTGPVVLPSAIQGTSYEQATPVLFSDDAPLSDLAVRITGLPPGLSGVFNADGTVTVRGTPTTSGTATFEIAVADASGNTASKSVSIVVAAPTPTPTPTTNNPPSLAPGAAFFPPVAIVGRPYRAVSDRPIFLDDNISSLRVVSDPNLPPGLQASIDGQGRLVISGTPRGPLFIDSVQGFDYTVVVDDGVNRTNVAFSGRFLVGDGSSSTSACAEQETCSETPSAVVLNSSRPEIVSLVDKILSDLEFVKDSGDLAYNLSIFLSDPLIADQFARYLKNGNPSQLTTWLKTGAGEAASARAKIAHSDIKGNLASAVTSYALDLLLEYIASEIDPNLGPTWASARISIELTKIAMSLNTGDPISVAFATANATFWATEDIGRSVVKAVQLNAQAEKMRIQIRQMQNYVGRNLDYISENRETISESEFRVRSSAVQDTLDTAARLQSALIENPAIRASDFFVDGVWRPLNRLF